MRRGLLAIGLAGMLALPAWAHEFSVGDLTIGHPYAIVTPTGARTGAGYLSVTNEGPEPDRLVAVKADFPRVELHMTEVDAAGVARMAGVEAVEVPPGATVTLAPQGTHVMFMGLTAPLEAGASLPAVLVFEKAGEVAVEFKVETRAEAAPEPGAHAGH
jgi:periplasmic copper chaperone A